MKFGVSSYSFSKYIMQTKCDYFKICDIAKEIGYDGDFTYEIHGVMMYVPDELRIQMGKFCYEIGMYLIDLYNKA